MVRRFVHIASPVVHRRLHTIRSEIHTVRPLAPHRGAPSRSCHGRNDDVRIRCGAPPAPRAPAAVRSPRAGAAGMAHDARLPREPRARRFGGVGCGHRGVACRRRANRPRRRRDRARSGRCEPRRGMASAARGGGFDPLLGPIERGREALTSGFARQPRFLGKSRPKSLRATNDAAVITCPSYTTCGVERRGSTPQNTRCGGWGTPSELLSSRPVTAVRRHEHQADTRGGPTKNNPGGRHTTRP